MEFDQLTKRIAAGQFSPLYYFFGEEPYFIDKLTRLVEEKALNPGEETFNKSVQYGGDAKAARLLSELRSFPMMAQRRLVILKEGQQMHKNEFEKLVPYLENPVDSTVFVIVFKDKKIDGRSKAYKALKEKGTVFESTPLYENQIAKWIEGFLSQRGYSIQPEALQVMVTYLGTNLSLIESELEKLFLYMKTEGNEQNRQITTAAVYDMINVDKDFNVFELVNAVGMRDSYKSHFIVTQMMKNVKDNPPILIVFQLFQFFNKLMLLHAKKSTNENDIAAALGIPKFIARQYVGAMRTYQLREVQRNLTYVLEADLYLKGVQQTHMGHEHVLKTLVFKLLN